MQVVWQCCAGLDVHKKTVVACVLRTEADGRILKQVRTFGTMTTDLVALRDWLRAQNVEQVALESTGVYSWPVFAVLEEGGLVPLVANPRLVKAVPGRKTDIKDSEWLADLLRHGLVRGSFVPPAAIRALRELTRYRTTLVRERAQEVNRLHKLLELANLKLASVATDILGTSGRLMLEALADGEMDPTVLAALARGRLMKKHTALLTALDGRLRPHQRLLLRAILDHLAALERLIARLDQDIAAALLPFAGAVALLRTIPGVSATAAAILVAELGVEMSRFGSAPQLASWAGVCPGNRQSGGKRLSGATTHGNVWLRAILNQIAWAAVRTKGTSFGARFRRLAARGGVQKAMMAVMHHLLIVIYHVLQEQEPYHELGPNYYRPQDPQRRARRHVRQLEELGYTVSITPTEAA